MERPLEHRQDLQILRGIAVVFVVLFHLEALFFENGYLGVDVFFVISGYLMARLFDRGTKTDFFRKRVDRLLPAYAVTIIAVVAAGYLMTIPVDFGQLFEQAIASMLLVPNVHFWSQNSYFEKAAFTPLLNLWSLGVEAQFYLIVPFLFPFLKRRKVMTALLAIVAFGLCVAAQTISPKTSFFMLPFRIWEFLIGAWIAWFLATPRAEGRLVGLQWVLTAALVLSIPFLPVQPEGRSVLTGHPSLAALWTCLATGAVIWIGMPARLVRSIPGRVLGVIGDYSYSIYLVHFPLIVLWNYREFGGTILGLKTPMDYVLLPLGIAVLSWISFRLFEKKSVLQFRTGLRRMTLVAGVFLVAFTANAAIDLRYSRTERAIFGAWEDRSAYRCGKLFRVLNPRDEICPLTESANGPRVLLVGNSHADALKTSFARVAARKNIAAFFYVQNEPLMSPAFGAQRVLADARRLKADAIILHFNNLYGTAAHQSEFRTLIETAHAAGIRVAIVAPVPTYPTSVPRAMYNAARAGTAAKIIFNISKHQEKTQAFRDFANSFPADKLSVFDPAPVLCPGTGTGTGTCLIAAPDKTPFYFDSHHLSLTGARLLEPLFASMLKTVTAGEKATN